jgi:hypothetical protein
MKSATIRRRERIRDPKYRRKKPVVEPDIVPSDWVSIGKGLLILAAIAGAYGLLTLVQVQ